MHGKTEGHEDPSKEQMQQQREESQKKAKIRSEELEGEPPHRETNVYIDARKWEGVDLNQTVGTEALKVEQAFSIMRLRKAIGKPEASRMKNDEDDAPAEGRESEEELIEDLWQDLQDLEAKGNSGDHEDESEQELVCDETGDEQQQ